MAMIPVSELTLERVKRLAVPFEDLSPEHVIVRALDALEGKPAATRVKPDVPMMSQPTVLQIKTKHTRERRNGRTGQRRDKYRRHLLETVYELGGKAIVEEARGILEKKIGGLLDPDDRKTVPSADEPRWWNDAKWVRDDFVKEGYFRKDSTRGIWELTDAGMKAAETGGV